MAKMDEGVYFSGTIGNVTFYQMYGRTYMRAKSTLTRKRVLKSAAFEKTRKHASDMGRAAKIGSIVYKALPANIKDRWLYRAITGEAASLLYKGKTTQETQEFLWKKYIEDTGVFKEAVIFPTGNNIAPCGKEVNKKLWVRFRNRWETQGRDYYYFKRAWQNRGYFSRERFRYVLDIMDQPWASGKSYMTR